jgi:hypothetical protein
VPAAPAANVDPTANGTFTGPINEAKRAVDAENKRTQQLENQTADVP